jgi:hypothetical protein
MICFKVLGHRNNFHFRESFLYLTKSLTLREFVMTDTSGAYDNLARLHREFVARYSRQAAKLVDQIATDHGSEAAYHAALALIHIRVDMDHEGTRPETDRYLHFVQEYPAANELFRQAVQIFTDEQKPRTKPSTGDLVAP